MDILSFFQWLNSDFFALPGAVLFLGAGILLTLKTGFIQFRGFPYFIHLVTGGIRKRQANSSDAINPFHALFAALSTSIGMGNIVGPTVAIAAGGPGALFWLLAYIFFGSVIKFTEVTFALNTRVKTQEGHIIGGPMEYLKVVSPFLAVWYGSVMSILFVGWCGLQSNTIASIYALEGVPEWVVGLALALFSWVVLSGGAKRVGALASKLVPIMFVLYVSFALYILFSNTAALVNAFKLVFAHIFTPASAVGGFLGSSVFQAIRFGAFRGVYISESGLGTSSIPHAMADVERPVDQGILAMGSTVADAILSLISGLLVLVTGIWTTGFSTTLVYEVFKVYSPTFGDIVLLISISLFVLTTVIGNSFNGMQSFSSLFGYRYVRHYMAFIVILTFLGSIMPVPLVWEIMDTFLFLAAVPNIVGILILAFTQPKVLDFK
jgi:AGCS family alanine or glycine:cation symporter